MVTERVTQLVENLISPNRQPNDLVSQAKNHSASLQQIWSQRQRLMEEWYEVIRLDDYLAQEDMESFISNRPKNVMRLARHLLTKASVTHAPLLDSLSDTQALRRGQIERQFRGLWRIQEKKYRNIGRQGWAWQLSGLMVSLGWHSVFLDITDEEATARIWNPYQVFPLWDERSPGGLRELVRTYQTSADDARRQIDLMGLPVPNLDKGGMVTVVDWWHYVGGVPTNTLLYGDAVIKGEIPHSDRGRIPVLISPAGGLPDMGVLPNNKDWAGSWGESIVANNTGVLRNFNRFFSFLMQMVRDSANPRWIEFVSGRGGILDPDTLFKRGGVFTAGTEDRVEPLAGPALPVEATTSLQDMAGLLQEGDFQDAALGNARQPISSIMLSQILATTQLVIDPYLESLKDIYTTTNEWWYTQMRKRGIKPKGFTLGLSDLPADLEFDVQVRLNLPGDITNRATQARMLSPTFNLSEEVVGNLLFSAEIEDYELELARKRSETALRHPVAQDLELIESFERLAEEAAANGDTSRAQRFRKAAQTVESTMGQRSGGQQPETINPAPNVQPVSPFDTGGGQ